MNRRYWADLGERVATSYGVTFVGMLMAHGSHLMSESSLRSAALAAIPACLTVLLGLLGAKVGVQGTPSLLPAQKPPAGPPGAS